MSLGETSSAFWCKFRQIHQRLAPSFLRDISTVHTAGSHPPPANAQARNAEQNNTNTRQQKCPPKREMPPASDSVQMACKWHSDASKMHADDCLMGRRTAAGNNRKYLIFDQNVTSFLILVTKKWCCWGYTKNFGERGEKESFYISIENSSKPFWYNMIKAKPRSSKKNF